MTPTPQHGGPDILPPERTNRPPENIPEPVDAEVIDITEDTANQATGGIPPDEILPPETDGKDKGSIADTIGDIFSRLELPNSDKWAELAKVLKSGDFTEALLNLSKEDMDTLCALLKQNPVLIKHAEENGYDLEKSVKAWRIVIRSNEENLHFAILAARFYADPEGTVAKLSKNDILKIARALARNLEYAGATNQRGLVKELVNEAPWRSLLSALALILDITSFLPRTAMKVVAKVLKMLDGPLHMAGLLEDDEHIYDPDFDPSAIRPQRVLLELPVGIEMVKGIMAENVRPYLPEGTVAPLPAPQPTQSTPAPPARQPAPATQPATPTQNPQPTLPTRPNTNPQPATPTQNPQPTPPTPPAPRRTPDLPKRRGIRPGNPGFRNKIKRMQRKPRKG